MQSGMRTRKWSWLAAGLVWLSVATAWADEGMWIPAKVDSQMVEVMQRMGLDMPWKDVYREDGPSLKDAMVSFGGFCSGVMVSSEGLLLTNHHCGFSAVNALSTLTQNYVRDGFVAESREKELPVPDLYVRFLQYSQDVTVRVSQAFRPDMTEEERTLAADSVGYLLIREVVESDSTLVATVDACYGGNEYWLSVYRDYEDVRLVFAPPSSVGKFGWDTDNWQWPRHTGDFCVFRVYAGADNRPARYAADNVPYRPAWVVPVSLDGYREGDFCMTIGYPGTTERWISSYGIEEMMQHQNQAMMDVRGVKQAVWKKRMETSEEIRLKYVSKYDESSNYWKNSRGTNEAIEHLGVLVRKKEREARVSRWIAQSEQRQKEYGVLTDSLAFAYRERATVDRALAYLGECFLNGPELVNLAFMVMNFDDGNTDAEVEKQVRDLLEVYRNMDLETDKEVFVAMAELYRKEVPGLLPAFYQQVDSVYRGNIQAFADDLYGRSSIATLPGLHAFLNRIGQNDTEQLADDPAVQLAFDLLMAVFEWQSSVTDCSYRVQRNERLLNKALREMSGKQADYPDANLTMRLSFGTVCGYAPADGVRYRYYTTVEGIFEKMKRHQGDTDFVLQPRLQELLAGPDFGRYANEDGGMNVCFITNNDITGGNSGSAVLNASGKLIGLAFDGNWEAMSGDVAYEPGLQRCISVDIRYVLYLIDRYGGAEYLMRELGLQKGND